MALPVYTPYKPPASYGVPGGAAQQQSILRALSNQPTPTTPNLNDVSFGGQAGGPGSDTGVVSNPGGVYPKGTPLAPPVGSPQSGPPTTTNNSGGSGSGGGGGQTYNYNDDPILAQIEALNARNIANAEAAALAARKQAEIGYGYDQALQYEDQATQQAAQQNPFSTLAQLQFTHDQRVRDLTEALNKSNLFYSGERIRQTGLEGRQSNLEHANANAALQQTFNQIAQSVLNARVAAEQQEIQGRQAAYERALQFALANNTGFPYGDGGGGGGGGGAAGGGGDWTYQVPGGSNLDTNAVLNAAQANAPTYGGTRFAPHMIMNEGQVFTDANGHRYVEVKYTDPTGRQGSSTEKVYIG